MFAAADAFDVAESVGKLGAPLSSADADAIVLKPLRPFSVGELCAARDPKLAASSAAAAARQRAGQSSTTGMSQLESLHFPKPAC